MLSRRSNKGDNEAGLQDVQLLRHLGMFVQLAEEGIAALDMKGVLHFVNRAWASMHGYETSNELLGKNINLFYTKERMKSEIAPFMEQTRRDGSATFNTSIHNLTS